MPDIFGVIGGDARQIYLAKSIARDGYDVIVSGFENSDLKKDLQELEVNELAERSNVIILPLPTTKDGKLLNAPFSSNKIILGDDFANLMIGKRVYGGLMDKLFKTSEIWQKIDAKDYYEREELVVGNAYLTAEGAIGLAINELPCALNGASCLVTGFGRIGKALCRYLMALGAQVDCAARKSKDLMNIRVLGCNPVQYSEMRKSYDIIFNTVPAMVLKAAQLSKQSADTVIIELASPPGGIDKHVAGRLGIRVINGQSLPGRVSPKTSGEFIKETIYNMMEE